MNIQIQPRIVTLSLYLNPVDINNFRFNDSIYLNIDGSGQYYKVLKIDGYDPTQPGKTCKVQLLKTVYITVPKNINADNGSIDMGGSGIVPNQTPLPFIFHHIQQMVLYLVIIMVLELNLL